MRTFHRFLEEMGQKVLIIMRGVSGTGKSTRARQLAGPTGAIFSTDDYFGDEDVYQQNFDPAKLADAHQWNQDRVRRALTQGVSPVVVDNTNIKPFEAKAYVLLGREFGYEIKIEEPQSPHWGEVQELQRRLAELSARLAAKNRHGVPPESIAHSIASYSPYSVEDAEQSIAPWEK